MRDILKFLYMTSDTMTGGLGLIGCRENGLVRVSLDARNYDTIENEGTARRGRPFKYFG